MTKKLIIIGSTAITAIVAVCLLTASLAWSELNAPLNLNEAILVDVPVGKSFNSLVTELENTGTVKNDFVLRLWVRLTGQGTRIQAGEYQLAPGTTHLQFIEKLVSGDITRYRISLIEGWTFSQALQEVQNHEKITSILQNLPASEIATRMGLDIPNPEGMIFPDTYIFSKGTTDLEILQRAASRLQEVLSQAWSDRVGALPFETPYQALTLASIVEKETGVAEERNQIAGVFIRRLESGMRLQSDPTVIYGMGADFTGNLRREDLQAADNRYNTYRNDGLPPSPIALAGLASIAAVLQPAVGDSLYFVAKGDGTHYFSSSLEEHNDAVRRYQLAPQAN